MAYKKNLSVQELQIPFKEALTDLYDKYNNTLNIYEMLELIKFGHKFCFYLNKNGTHKIQSNSPNGQMTYVEIEFFLRSLQNE